MNGDLKLRTEMILASNEHADKRSGDLFVQILLPDEHTHSVTHRAHRADVWLLL